MKTKARLHNTRLHNTSEEARHESKFVEALMWMFPSGQPEMSIDFKRGPAFLLLLLLGSLSFTHATEAKIVDSIGSVTVVETGLSCLALFRPSDCLYRPLFCFAPLWLIRRLLSCPSCLPFHDRHQKPYFSWLPKRLLLALCSGLCLCFALSCLSLALPSTWLCLTCMRRVLSCLCLVWFSSCLRLRRRLFSVCLSVCLSLPCRCFLACPYVALPCLVSWLSCDCLV